MEAAGIDAGNMAGRSRDTFKKRQKEVARAEKAQAKAARRVERKAGILPDEPDDERPEDDGSLDRPLILPDQVDSKE